MLRKEKATFIFKALLSILLISALIVGCGKATKPNKKKDVIQQIIIVNPDKKPADTTSSEDNTSSDYNYDDKENSDYENDAVESERRPLAEKEEDTQQQTFRAPEYSVSESAWSGPDGYTIIYAKGNANTKAAAVKLQKYYATVGKTVAVADDTYAVTQKEILVGDSNRLLSKLNTNEYTVEIHDNKLVFAGGHFAMVETAVDWFVSLKYTSGKANLLYGKINDFASTVKGKYEYVWGDEFGGSALDMVKWCYKDKMAGTNLMPCLRDSNVVNVNEGLLKMTAIRYYDPKRPAAQYATNSSICTQDTMSWQYGYLEMRAMVPFKHGAWPSFWTQSDKALGNPSNKAGYFVEVDIFEIFSSESDVVPNIHKWYNDGSWSQMNAGANKDKVKKYIFENTDNLINEYHTYGFEWTPEEMIMSVDGEDYMTFDLSYNFNQKDTMEGFHDPMFIILNNFIYPPDLQQTTSSNQINNHNLPSDYFVDYIRLYQIPGVGSLNLPK